MASTITLDTGSVGRGNAGDKFIRRGSGNLGVYATNGIAVTPAQLELTSLGDLDVGNPAGYVLEWVQSTGKVKAYRGKDPGNAGGADIPLVEVANAVDLSAVTFRFRAEGN